MVRVEFNGRPVGRAVDAYAPKIDTKMAALGDVDVKPGENVLRLESAGRNSSSSGCYAGVDAVMLVPTRP